MVVLTATGTGLAELPVERTMVAATADASAARILVRWRIEEGTSRYSFFDVLRRGADETSFTTLNTEPVGALETAVEIESVFNAPGRADALASIIGAMGADYANDLLKMQGLDAPPESALQARLLPDANYGAALVLGRGYLDEAVTLGSTYVYEVWGLDDRGFRVERLGRATATAGAPEAILAPGGLVCADVGGFQAHMQAGLRWTAPATAQPYFGFELQRSTANGDGSCPPEGPAWAKVNRFPVLANAPGRVSEGGALFASRCAGCHVGGRDAPPVLGSTSKDFRIRQYPAELCAGGEHVGLLDLTPEALRAIYDYIHEFQFIDDGSITPAIPLVAGQDYCYAVSARDLIGNPGLAATVRCDVPDRFPPDVPKHVQSKQVTAPGSHETCEISWRVNRRPGDDTARYVLYRSRASLPTACTAATIEEVASFAQPGAGVERIVTTDPALVEGDRGKLFYYAVRAEDTADEPGDAPNLSDYSSWVPCVPRDIRRPSSPTFHLACLDPLCADCDDHTGTQPLDDWKLAGGGSYVVADPAFGCPPRIVVDGYDVADTFKLRTYRSFGGTDFLPGADFPPGDPGVLPHQPLLDAKLCTKLRAYDKSGNLSVDLPAEVECHLVRGNQPIPAPEIISVTPTGVLPEEVRIRFRSLEPGSLLGFALYDQLVDPLNPDAPPIKGAHQQRMPIGNLGDLLPPGAFDVCIGAVPSSQDAGWAVRDSAAPLAQLLPIDVDPAGTLTYDSTKHIYEWKTSLSGLGESLLYLVAVGWTGCEGNGRTFRWSDTTRVPAADGFLDWPIHQDFNGPVLDVLPGEYDPDLILTPQPTLIEVSWRPYPSCLHFEPEDVRHGPFAVFRRREGALVWQQISPLIECIPGMSTDMKFLDRDVEDDTWYTYVVVRQAKTGEFFHQHGPAYEPDGLKQMCFNSSGAAACGPEPE